MKQRVINGNSLEFYNSDNSKKGEIKISGSDVIINPIDSSGTVIFGEEGTINDIEVGASGTPVDFTFLGGGTITPNGGTLTLGNSGDTIDLSNATIGTITASIFKGGSFIGDGSGLTNTPSTFTNITASGDISASGDIITSGNVSASLTGSFTKILVGGATSFAEAGTQIQTNNGIIDVGTGTFRGTRGKFNIITNRLSGNDIIEFTSANNVSILGPITASGDISASGQFVGANFGLDSTDKLQFSDGTLQFRLSDASRITHTSTVFRPTSDEGVSLGRTAEKWKELVVNHITASGGISASGQIKAQSFEFDYQQSVTGVNSAGNLIVYLRTDSGQFGAVNGSSNIARALQTGNTNGWQIGSSNAGITGKQSTDTIIITSDGNDVLTVTGSKATFAGDVTVEGTLTAQEFHTEFVSASIMFESGSTKFGDTLDDVHNMTGSLNVTGSATINGGIFTAKGPDEVVARIERTAGSGYTVLDIKDGVGTTGNSVIRFSDTGASKGAINYEHADDSLRITTNASEQLRITSDGNVGIGNITPPEALTVEGNISASGTGSFRHGVFNLPSASANEKILQVQKAGSNVFYVDEDGDGVFSGIVSFKNYIYGTTGNSFVGGRQDLVLGMNWNNDTAGTSIKFTKDELNNSPSNTLMLISSSGNVGIGTTTPFAKLHLSGSDSSAESAIRQSRAGRGIWDQAIDSSGRLQWGYRAAGSEGGTRTVTFTLDDNNRVAMGFGHAPDKLLHVSGSGGHAAILLEKSDNDAIIETRTNGAGAYFRANSFGSSNYYGLELNNDTTGNWFLGSYGYADFSIVDGAKSSGTRHFTVKNTTGNVGIGTTAPPEKLTVEGNISASGNVEATSFTGSFSGTITGDATGLTGTPDISVRHITASGNISSSGHISSSGLYVESSTITDFIKLNSLGSSANPIKLIFEKAASEQGIIEYNRNGDLEIYNTDGDGGVMIDGSTSAGGDLYVANSGNVGIGTTTPVEKLTVVGDISASVDVHAQRNLNMGHSTNDPELLIYNNQNVNRIFTHDSASSQNAQLVIRGGNWTHALQLKDSYNGTGQNADDLYYARLNGGYNQESKLTLFTSQSVGGLSAGATTTIGTATSSLPGKLTVTGNVGIGTTTPSQKLDVQGTILVNNEVQFVDSNMRIFRSSNDMRLRTGGSDRMTIDSSGNVGIGTTSPGEKLEVVGNISSSATTFTKLLELPSGTGGSGGINLGTHSHIFESSGLVLDGGTSTRPVKLRFNGNDALIIGRDNHITASANISASGNIKAETMTVVDTITAGGISGPLTTAAQSNITSLGTLTTLTVDDITINGSTISDGGDLTIDAGGDITIDADGADVILKDGGTEFGRFKRDSSNFVIKSATNDKDLVFRGVDNTATITALTLDMSEAGNAIFNNEISASGRISGLDYAIDGNLLADMAGSTIAFGYQNDTPIQIGRSANPIKFMGEVTASGGISASGKITTNTLFIADTSDGGATIGNDQILHAGNITTIEVEAANLTAGIASTVAAVATTDNAEFFVGVLDGASGTQAVETSTRLKFNPNSGKLTVSGDISSSSDITANNLVIAGDITSVGDDVSVGDNILLTSAAGQLQFTGTSGGGNEGITYKDSGGGNRYGLLFPGSNVVALANRASNGTVQIRANTSTAGSGGEVTVAEFEDNIAKFNTNISSSGYVYSKNAQYWSTTGRLTVGNNTTNYYGPNPQGTNYYFWNRDLGTSSTTITAKTTTLNSGWKLPYKAVLTGYHLNIQGRSTTDNIEFTLVYSDGMWDGDVTSTSQTLVEAESGQTVSIATANNFYELDRRGQFAIPVSAMTMLYPRFKKTAATGGTAYDFQLAVEYYVVQ